MYNEIDDQFLLKQIKRNSFKNKHVHIYTGTIQDNRNA